MTVIALVGAAAISVLAALLLIPGSSGPLYPSLGTRARDSHLSTATPTGTRMAETRTPSASVTPTPTPTPTQTPSPNTQGALGCTGGRNNGHSFTDPRHAVANLAHRLDGVPNRHRNTYGYRHGDRHAYTHGDAHGVRAPDSAERGAIRLPPSGRSTIQLFSQDTCGPANYWRSRTRAGYP